MTLEGACRAGRADANGPCTNGDAAAAVAGSIQASLAKVRAEGVFMDDALAPHPIAIRPLESATHGIAISRYSRSKQGPIGIL